MFDPLKRFIKKWRASRDGGHQLDALLAIADRSAPYPERSEWLIELAHWIRRGRAVQPGALNTDAETLAAMSLALAREESGDGVMREIGTSASRSTARSPTRPRSGW